MHMGMLAHAILHATVAGVIGFFVLFAAGKAEGVVKFVGTILGWWLWIIAVLSIVCVFVCPMVGGKMGEKWGMHGDWMHTADKPAATAPESNATAPAKPDASGPDKITPPPKKP